MSGMNVTEAQFEELQRNVSGNSSLVPRPPFGGSRKAKEEIIKPLVGPVDVTLILYGHCPSKKSDYRVSESGHLITRPETKKEMETLTMQALMGWTFLAPVEHPELTIRFFVSNKRQDRDGMLATLMDVLQKGGVLVNDNVARCNARLVLEPAEVVSSPSDERVEIRILKQ